MFRVEGRLFKQIPPARATTLRRRKSAVRVFFPYCARLALLYATLLYANLSLTHSLSLSLSFFGPEDQKSVFGEFAQFNRNQLQGGGGSGLGLWISRRIIHMHKGRGNGSTFYFEIPLYPSDGGALGSGSSASLLSLTYTLLSHIHFLTT